MKDKAVHFSTMLAASICTNKTIRNVNPDNSYTNVTKFDRSAVDSFCKNHQGYVPLKVSIGSSLGDFIAIFQE